MSNRRNQRTRRQRAHQEQWWSADDALAVHARLINWLRTRHGVYAAYQAYRFFYGGQFPDTIGDPWAFAASTAIEYADTLAACHPIWCDPAMVDLLAGAADSYPPEPFVQHHLPSPDGIILFAKPLPAVWRDEAGEAESVQQISAITWGTGASRKGDPVISIISWVRHVGLARFDDPKRAVYFDGLRNISHAAGPFGVPPADRGGPAGPNRILQTFAALCRTPLIRDELTAQPEKEARSTLPSGTGADRTIRRVYLRKPEYGHAELDAAREARSGRPPRGHWVRGHWKQQWYPSIEEHRMRWIEGYPRGNFAAGTVGGTKMLIAAGDKEHDSETKPPPRTPR